MIRCKDVSRCSNRVLIIDEVDENNDQIAIWPEMSPDMTVWIDKDDVAVLIDKLTVWVNKRNGRAYKLPSVSGDI